ncbi:hypothetical protein [Verrucomicrobium sp. BvORR034]|uniref:hypothetical protein n=1 Tax=Verrucomicrobium sp. BvORR034 TaxID=1396418 RepID=UPI00067946BA|nr:hypothetical protein [Verrucomicrobium sp. BvORR034]
MNASEPPPDHGQRDLEPDPMPPAWKREGEARVEAKQTVSRRPRVPGIIWVALVCLWLPAWAGAMALAVEVAGGQSNLKERMVDVIWLVLVLRLGFGLLTRSAWSRWCLVTLVGLTTLMVPLMWGRVTATGERFLLMAQLTPMVVGVVLLLTPAAGRWFRK